MRRAQVLLLCAAIAAVALIGVLGSRGGTPRDQGIAAVRAQPAAGAIRVHFAYSPDKAKLLRPLIDRYNASSAKVDGRRVFVVGQNIASGDAQTKIAAGRLKPTVWTPVSSLWGRLLNFAGDRPYVPAANPSIVRTTMIIAMWEQMARALGCPQRPVGFGSDRVVALSPIARVGRRRVALQALVSRLIAGGGTAIYDATAAAFDQVGAGRQQSHQRGRAADRR